jgi:TolB-like protein
MQSTWIKLGGFLLDPYRQLLNNGQSVIIGRKALNILSVLAEAKGALVSKDELMDAVWPGLIVEDNAVQVHIGALRKILADDAGLLVTVRGLGYRLDMSLDENELDPCAAVDNSVAVLNFVNMTGEPALDYLGEGVVEELINILSSQAGLKVPSRTSSFAYKDRHIDARQISSELGVAHLIEGSVRVSGEQMRVTAQLIDARDGNHVWSSNFDHEFSDLLALQGDMAGAIAQAITPYLTNNPDMPASDPVPTLLMPNGAMPDLR